MNLSDLILGPSGWECGAVEHRTPGSTFWCDHIREMIECVYDAEEYHADMRLTVPIFPASDVFAQIYILQEIVPGGAAPMEMRYTPDIGREKVFALGFWNPGEGMSSMRSVVLDTLRSMLDPAESFTRGAVKTQCPQNSHPLKYTNEINKRVLDSDVQAALRWRQRLLWNIAMEGACSLCIADTQGVPDNFGIDPDSVGNAFRPNSGGPF